MVTTTSVAWVPELRSWLETRSSRSTASGDNTWAKRLTNPTYVGKFFGRTSAAELGELDFGTIGCCPAVFCCKRMSATATYISKRAAQYFGKRHVQQELDFVYI